MPVTRLLTENTTVESCSHFLFYAKTSVFRRKSAAQSDAKALNLRSSKRTGLNIMTLLSENYDFFPQSL